jgi:Histidine kinase-, DNA gyrase B-, and HSP90-like ATPase
MKSRTERDHSIIALDKFILATRDSGYKGTSSALSELVDNSLQAGAKEISIKLFSSGAEGDEQFEVQILDDGAGMDPFTLRHALRFGGSSRFGDRSGLGRYGMGLPNASLSQARRFTVYTWATPQEVYSSYLDVDEIARGELTEVPAPRRASLPIGKCPTKSGTLVVWSRCDRLENRRISTITRKVSAALGQTFRLFLWGGVKISINDAEVQPVDPLFLRRGASDAVADVFGDPMEYEVSSNPADPNAPAGRIKVLFTLLPVHAWHHLSNDEKRELGLAKGAGVSVIRGGREVDYGWFFMGAKRRENYDDWFRCQVEFDPVLDEAFGITHTKQQVRPQQYLSDILTPDIEATAHALNARVRKAHAAVATSERVADSEKIASARDKLLPPLTAKAVKSTAALALALKRRHPLLRSGTVKSEPNTKYKLVEDDFKGTDFFAHAIVDGRVVVAMNQAHPFYRKVYGPLTQSENPHDKALCAQIELMLMAASRASAALAGKGNDEVITRFRKLWSDALATFLNG